MTMPGNTTIPLFANFASSSACLDGAGPSSAASGSAGGAAGGVNAASLAHSLYAGWQQQHVLPGACGGNATSLPMQTLQALPMERGVSWGAELLPFVMDDSADGLMDPSMLEPEVGGGRGASSAKLEPGSAPPNDLFDTSSMLGGEDGPAGSKQPLHKARFVWTGELHRRFEAAVNTLGIDQAKPQAISQLMNCEGEGAPTRQNIKSHLQKYRLLMQKRASKGGGGDSAEEAMPSARGGSAGGAGGAGGAASLLANEDVHNELEQHLEKQEMNLKMQMDLQTKLHRQLLVQRQLQHQLEHCFPSSGEIDCHDRQRYQATVTLKDSLRERLTKHVMLQQEMLQHLDTLVSNEVSKYEAGDAAEADEDD